MATEEEVIIFEEQETIINEQQRKLDCLQNAFKHQKKIIRKLRRENIRLYNKLKLQRKPKNSKLRRQVTSLRSEEVIDSPPFYINQSEDNRKVNTSDNINQQSAMDEFTGEKKNQPSCLVANFNFQILHGATRSFCKHVIKADNDNNKKKQLIYFYTTLLQFANRVINLVHYASSSTANMNTNC